MSMYDMPEPAEINYHSDLRWRRQAAALKSLEPGDVLAAVEDLIAQEPDPEQHPLYSLAAHALDRRVMPGTWKGLWMCYRKLIDHAVEKLIEQRLADPSCWEVD